METRPHASSTGQIMTAAPYIDAHFECCKPEYEALLRSAGFERGWHILDAGAGTGGFLPWIADIVGETGQITALDLAQENVGEIQRNVGAWGLSCPVQAVAGSILDLPFEDDAFDGVWVANTLIYVYNDAHQWGPVLAELRRVVRPGGLIAIKDVDSSLNRIRPSDPVLLNHFARAGTRRPNRGVGYVSFNRTWNLRRALQQAGLTDVWQQSTLIERWSPLGETDREFLTLRFGSIMEMFLPMARQKTLKELSVWFGIQEDKMAEELRFWEAMARFDDPNHIFSDPDFYWSEGQVLAVGRLPQS